MVFHNMLKKLEGSAVFKGWHSSDDASFLSYAMYMDNSDEWQIGYYSSKKDLITTFIVAEDVTISGEEKVFKKDEHTVKKINIDKIKVSLDDARKLAGSIQKKKYASHLPMKRIFILQNLEIGQVWNITYVTKTFKTLNMKISTETGEIVEEKLVSLFRFDK